MNPWLITKILLHFPRNIHPFLSSIVILQVIQSLSYDSLILQDTGNTSSLYDQSDPAGY